MSNAKHLSQKLLACPHLGMLDDTTTTTTFPSEFNHCLHCKIASIPSNRQQSEFCLTPDFADCEIHKQSAPNRLPPQMRWQHEPTAFMPIFIKTGLAVFFAGILAVFFILGTPARISQFIQAFNAGASHPGTQPAVFSTRTPTSDLRTPYQSATSVFDQITIFTSIPINQIVQLTVIDLEKGAYCRSGPDTSFDMVSVLYSGDTLQALARDSADRYFLVRVNRQYISDCWVAQSCVRVLGDRDSLPQYTPNPTPRPTRTPMPQTPTQKNQTPPISASFTPTRTPTAIPTITSTKTTQPSDTPTNIPPTDPPPTDPPPTEPPEPTVEPTDEP